MLQKDSSKVQRQDCIMSIVTGDNYRESLALAPMNFNGIGTLLNTSKKPNCKSVLCEVNGTLNIIIYSCKKINKRE
jgi:hypothetical protein